MLVRTTLLIGLHFLFLRTANGTCYWPSGEAASTNYEACNYSGGMCCDKTNDDVCSPEGLCVYQSDSYFRDACTDPTWKSPSCVAICMQTSNSSDALTKCADGSFCCDYSGSTCCNNGEGIKLSPTSSSPSSSATSTSSLSGTSTSTVTGKSTTTEAPATATTSTSEAKSNNLPIGLGVGLGAGALVIAGAGGLIWYLRSRKPRGTDRSAELNGNLLQDQTDHKPQEHFYTDQPAEPVEIGQNESSGAASKAELPA